jgi:hypothetical protein
MASRIIADGSLIHRQKQDAFATFLTRYCCVKIKALPRAGSNKEYFSVVAASILAADQRRAYMYAIFFPRPQL